MSNSFGYSLRVKNGSEWRSFNRVRLMISVGQEYHEGKKLHAVVNWINRNPTIDTVHVSVNDALQRHNYAAEGHTQQQAKSIALAEGTLWLARNEEALAGLTASKTITRWNDWFENSEYPATRATLDNYRRSNLEFEAALNTDASAHAARKMNRGETIPEALTKYTTEYLLEELAVFAIQAKKLPAAEVYPGSNLIAAEYLLGKTLPDEIAPLASRYFTRVDFARINMHPANMPLARHKPS
jgi:tRNA-dependent cyclodipeptide synthase